MLEGLVFGFLGSFHCIGMCGPIALSLPFSQYHGVQKVLAIVVYNIGRVITYSVIGAIFGFLGLGFRLAGYQQFLSIALGSFMIFSVLSSYVLNRTQIHKVTLLARPIAIVSNLIGKLLRSSGFGTLFSVGLLNGLLPCGFVYLGLIWTMSLADIGQGALFMAMFGLGTIPAMLSVSFAADMIKIKLRNQIKRWIPAFILLIGIILIFRGLNLGIPYLSPQLLHQESANSAICH
jgi:uncharacterized protein